MRKSDFVYRPYEVDSTHSGTRLMTFGSGPHQCLGQHFSRLELEPMIRTLVETDYALVEDRVLVTDSINSALRFKRCLPGTVPCSSNASAVSLNPKECDFGSPIGNRSGQAAFSPCKRKNHRFI